MKKKNILMLFHSILNDSTFGMRFLISLLLQYTNLDLVIAFGIQSLKTK